jgi:hypothetical protein
MLPWLAALSEDKVKHLCLAGTFRLIHVAGSLSEPERHPPKRRILHDDRPLRKFQAICELLHTYGILLALN